MYFCCDVDESDLKIKASVRPSNGFHKKCSLISENEVLFQKWLCYISCIIQIEVSTTILRDIILLRVFSLIGTLCFLEKTINVPTLKKP